MQLHRGLCLFLGWSFTLVGMAIMVLDNHVGHTPIASPEWWAQCAPFPIGALFLIAYGVAKENGN